MYWSSKSVVTERSYGCFLKNKLSRCVPPMSHPRAHPSFTAYASHAFDRHARGMQASQRPLVTMRCRRDEIQNPSIIQFQWENALNEAQRTQLRMHLILFRHGWFEGYIQYDRFFKGKVSALLGEGQFVRRVSRKVGVPKTTVHRWKTCFFPFLKNYRSKLGRRKISSQTDQFIVQFVRNDPSLPSTKLRNSLQSSLKAVSFEALLKQESERLSHAVINRLIKACLLEFDMWSKFQVRSLNISVHSERTMGSFKWTSGSKWPLNNKEKLSIQLKHVGL